MLLKLQRRLAPPGTTREFQFRQSTDLRARVKSERNLVPEENSLFVVRAEAPKDVDIIRKLTTAAFKQAAHSSGTEAAIVDALRAGGALTVSLVAIQGDEIVGHVAFSPVTIGSGPTGWFGLGPISVLPDRQGTGIGKALIESGLARLRAIGANGCVVLGNPRYYARFGFVSDPALRYADVPTEYFQRIVFTGSPPTGEVAYHAGFDTK